MTLSRKTLIIIIISLFSFITLPTWAAATTTTATPKAAPQTTTPSAGLMGGSSSIVKKLTEYFGTPSTILSVIIASSVDSDPPQKKQPRGDKKITAEIAGLTKKMLRAPIIVGSQNAFFQKITGNQQLQSNFFTLNYDELKASQPCATLMGADTLVNPINVTKKDLVNLNNKGLATNLDYNSLFTSTKKK